MASDTKCRSPGKVRDEAGIMTAVGLITEVQRAAESFTTKAAVDPFMQLDLLEIIGDAYLGSREAHTQDVCEDMIHIWPVFAPILPEGQQAIERIGEFIREHTG